MQGTVYALLYTQGCTDPVSDYLVVWADLHDKTKWTTFFSIFVLHPIFHNWIY